MRKAIIGVGGVMVDRRAGVVTVIGSAMTQADDVAYHRKYDQETGESPWMNRTCGCRLCCAGPAGAVAVLDVHRLRVRIRRLLGGTRARSTTGR